MGGQGSARAANTDLIAAAEARAPIDGALGAGVGPMSLPEPDAGSASATPSNELYLEVWHGDRALGKIGHFTLRDGVLWCTRDELRELGVVVGDEVASDDDGSLPLDRLQGLTYHYDPGNQRLVLEVPADLRPHQVLGYASPPAGATAIPTTCGRGLPAT
jgi:outer membrane usher protein FimD/PapC